MASAQHAATIPSIELSTRLILLHNLLALQAVLVDGEGILEEFLFFLQVDGLETRGHGSAGSTAGIEDVTAVVVLRRVQQGLNTGLGVAPGTGVEGLLLGPDDVTGVGVAVQVLLELGPREGVKLLNAGDGSVAKTLGLTVLHKGGVHLARAQDDTLDLLRLVDSRAVGRVGDDPLEVRVASEFLNGRAGNRVTQERLGEEDHQGCSNRLV